MSDAESRKAALLVATLTSFLTPFMGASINIALPAIGREFSMDAVALSWVATTYLLAAAMFLLPFGKIADIRGRKKVFFWGISLYTLSSLLAAGAPGASWLIGCRIVQGIGSAMLFGTGVAILISVFPPGERGRVLGFNVAAVYCGLSLGPFLGGFLTQQWGWRSIFLANVPLGLLIVLFVRWKLRGEWAEARGERFDLSGSVIYSLSLAFFIYGLSLLPALSGVCFIVAGVVGSLWFIRWETRVENPLLSMGLFRGNRVFALSNLAALINYSATSAVGFLLSLYLQYVKGLTPRSAGLVLVAQPVVMAVFSPFAGRLSDRLEPRLVASAGMATAVAGLLGLSFVDQGTSLGFIMSSLVLLGFGFALFSSPNTNAVMGSVEKRLYGVASATLGTMRLTGQMLSMGLSMLVFSLCLGKVQITPEYFPPFLRSVRIAFVLFSALCLGGIFASLARGKVR